MRNTQVTPLLQHTRIHKKQKAIRKIGEWDLGGWYIRGDGLRTNGFMLPRHTRILVTFTRTDPPAPLPYPLLKLNTLDKSHYTPCKYYSLLQID